jgi:hypothetical protein
MSPVLTFGSTIPPTGTTPFNPLDLIVQNCGRKLASLQMTRLVGEADKSDAQALTRDLLDIARIIDSALLEIGREAKAHFGRGVDLCLYTDRLLDSLEGETVINLCQAVEAREEEFAEEMGGAAADGFVRDYAA